MTEFVKTLIFVAVGAAAVAAAYFINLSDQPEDAQSYVGVSLNKDLQVDEPKRLRIIKFDRETAETRQFEVAAVDGVWSIPSKQNYPADATQQMAKAANALIDRKVLRVAAESAEEHERLGVVDPQSSKLNSSSQGVGTRVIMTDGEDKTLVDMIIGKKVKGAEGQRFVRNANQNIVYVVEVDPESLSTSFEDWIEDDLLKLSPFDIRRVFINDYSADLSLGITADGQIAPQISWDRRAEITLGYNNDEAKWELASLKKYDRGSKSMVDDSLAPDEELNQEALNAMRTALDDLLIVDVARKPEGLSDDLKAGKDFMTNREAFEDLIAKGFSPVPLKPNAPPEILSSEGEVVCTQRDGVEYVLRFGQLQVQTESAAGAQPSADDEAAATDEEAAVEPENAGDEAAKTADGSNDAAKPEAAADAESAKADSQEEKNLRRYLFVMARFNQDIIEKPELKELPPLPEGAEAPADGAATGDAEPDSDGAAADGASEPPAETPDEETADEAPAPVASEAPADGAADEEAPAAESDAAEDTADEASPGGDQPDAAEPDEPTDEDSPEEAAEPATDDASPDAPADEEPSSDAAEADAAEAAEETQPADVPDAPADAADAERDAAVAARKAVEEENKRAQDEYNDTVEAGKKRVEELNQRFGDWYYVISNDVFKQIHLGRAQVIKKKEPAEGSKGAADAEPGTGLPNLPAASEPAGP